MTEFEKMTNEELRAIEAEQLKQLDGLGLFRKVEHDRYKKPHTLLSGKIVVGHTMAKLHLKSQPADDGGLVVGIATCSASESGFRKIIGRIRATGRALRTFKRLKKRGEYAKTEEEDK